MIALWPWKLPPLLASIYAGPFLAYGVSAFMLAREGRPEARRIVLASMLAFTVLVIVASLLHLALFSFATSSAWVWFGLLAASGAVLTLRPAGGEAMNDRALAETRAWVERAVIGLNLCPFAKAPQNEGPGALRAERGARARSAARRAWSTS